MRIKTPEGVFYQDVVAMKTNRVAVVTMAYNEGYFLPLWQKYYGAEFGYENLYVLDHGSTDGSTDRLACNRIRIPRSNFDDLERAAMVSDFHRSLLTCFERVIYTDCDEFIALNPAAGGSLKEYVQNSPYEVIRCIGVDVIQHSFDLPPLDLSFSLLKQRPYGSINAWESKPLISSVPLQWHVGFHDCDRPTALDSNVWLFHLKFADVTHCLERLQLTRALEWSEQSIRTDMGITQRLDRSEVISLLQWYQTNKLDQPIDRVDFFSVYKNRQSTGLYSIPEGFRSRL